MPDPNTLALIVYRLAAMLLGLAIVYMGYRLFLSGLFEKAGDLKAAWGPNHLELKQAAPGSFYAVLGTIVIVTSLVKGFSVSPTGANAYTVVGSGDLGPVAITYGASMPTRELAMLDIARKAVKGERITQAERDSFLAWSSPQYAPFDTGRARHFIFVPQVRSDTTRLTPRPR